MDDRFKLGVLAVSVIAGITAGQHVAENLVAPAAAQQPGQSQQESEQPPQSQQSQQQPAQPGQEPQTDEQIARAAGQTGMMTMALSLERSSEHGEYLADADGRALYLLESDSAGESQCYDRCAEQWPPALAAAGQQPQVEDRQIDDSLLGTIDRRDGGTQITYGDHPLYYYARDAGPGQTTGHDVHDEWGGWYLVAPEGEAVEDSGSEN